MNPQVSVAFALTGDLSPLSLPAYLLGQFLGAGAAAVVVLILYLDTLTPAALAAMASSPGVTQSTFPLVGWVISAILSLLRRLKQERFGFAHLIFFPDSRPGCRFLPPTAGQCLC